MKCFILLLALSVLSSCVIGTFHDKKVILKTRLRRNYGSNYGRIEIAKPAVQQTIAFDTPRASGYGQQQQQFVQQPIALDTRVNSGYGQAQIVRPVIAAPVVSPIALDTTHMSGYGQAIVQTTTAAPVIAMDRPVVSSGYGQQQTIAMDRPVVSSGYGQQQTIAMDRPVVSSGYGQQQQQIAQPVQTIAFDRPVVSSGYGQTATIALDNTVELALEPEYRNICLNRAQGSVFYLPHPTRPTFYIQCDEFGQAFLKECPANTIFTQNLVCEDVKNLLPIESKPEFDQKIGSYGAAPQFALDTTSTAHVEVIVEAPEFKHLCANRNAYGAQVSSVFYIAHPTKQSFYIQCDEFGRAFLKECPIGTIFTSNMVCERVGEIHTETIVQQPVVQQVAQPVVQQLDRVETSNYGQAVATPVALDTPTQTRVEIIVEAPEFKNLCANRNAYGAATSSVFYVAHPTKQSFYIQCDEFGRAFLKECPANTIFTQNLVCENVNDLHTVERETIVQQALDQASSGSYGSVPKFSQDAVVSTQSQVEVVVEAPEFKELCLSKNTYGAPVSSVFYVAHPTDRRRYIQCNEFGNAYLKECPLNTVFTSNLVCEQL